MHRILHLLLLLLLAPCCLAQQAVQSGTFLNHLDIAATAGTSGIGFDMAMPLSEHLDVRAGFSYMPRAKFYMDLQVTLEDGYEEVPYGKPLKEQSKKMKNLMTLLNDLTGLESDSHVYVHLIPIFYNGKVLVDWKPFHDKSWHFTTGVYFGPSHIGTAYNYADETAFLLALNGYVNIYDHVLAEDPVISVGDASVEFSPSVNKKILEFGRPSFYIGPKKDGSYYHTLPLTDGTVHADCYANAIKPYLGFGYGSTLGKSGRCTLSFEGGCLFWGGTPTIITHDGVDLAHDMQYIKKNSLRHLVDWISAMKVYPILEARLAWRIF